MPVKTTLAIADAAIAGAALALFAVPAHAIDLATAKRAVDAAVATIPGDDTKSDARGHYVQVADLNGDGVDEIVYMETETCNGANFDCPNGLRVMTALAPVDERAPPLLPGLPHLFGAQVAAARASGYADDATEQIPGAVTRVAISGDRIAVTFDVRRDSPICKRTIDRDASPCPDPGTYRWVYAWTPRKLARVQPRAP